MQFCTMFETALIHWLTFSRMHLHLHSIDPKTVHKCR